MSDAPAELSARSPAAAPRRRLIKRLAIEVTPMSADEASRALVGGERKRVVVGHNLHSAYLYHTDATFRSLYDGAEVVLVDGQPIRLLGLWGEHGSERAAWARDVRVGSVDWLKLAGSSWTANRVAVIGASAASNSKTTELLMRQLETEVRGWPGENWSEDRAAEVVAALKDYCPEITIIGLGMPLQEHFVARHLESLPPGTFALVGGAIDQMSGEQVRAPDWVGRIGFEWLWRLARNPRRLAHRYLIEPILLASLLRRIQ